LFHHAEEPVSRYKTDTSAMRWLADGYARRPISHKKERRRCSFNLKNNNKKSLLLLPETKTTIFANGFNTLTNEKP